MSGFEEARRAEVRRRQLRPRLFGRYLAPRGVVEQLLMNPDDVELGGARQEVTILFADWISVAATMSENQQRRRSSRSWSSARRWQRREIFASSARSTIPR
ncbi:MAG: hypothetical protein R3A46_12265 [Thermomicrobiales bacterium]